MTDLAAFVGISAAVILLPGQDTALTIRNTVVGGRSAGLATAAGVVSGQLVWVLASSLGLVGVLLAYEPLYDALKVVGAVYLVALGAVALRSALRDSGSPGPSSTRSARRLGTRSAWRQGVLSNVANPKMAVFFTSLLPQFAPVGPDALPTLLMLGGLFGAMTLAWLSSYATVVSLAGDLFRRSSVRRTLEGITGVVLVGLGLRLATESR